MFARQALRAAQPLRQSIRRYATPPGPAGASSNTAAYAAIGAAALGGGFYYYQRTSSPSIASTASAPPSSAEKTTVPPVSALSGPAAFTGGSQGFISLKLDRTEEINHNTKKLVFALPESDNVSGLQIASALLTKYKGAEMEKPVIRPYTPTSDEDARGFIELVVKKYPGGPMSEHLHNMAPGQRLDFKGPIPKYGLKENMHEHVALIAGGTGITPMYQLARAIFKNPNDKTKVTLVFGNLTEEDILLKSELADLENTYPQRFRAFYVLDKPPPDWTAGSGHITKELLKTVLPEPKDVAGGKGKIFVCGPPGLYKAISGTKVSPQDQGDLSGVLKELGYGKEDVFKF